MTTPILRGLTWYIAGPMSGMPRFNYPAFDAAAALIREAGGWPLSPAELDPPDVQRFSRDSPDGVLPKHGPLMGYRHLLANSVSHLVREADGVLLLPGWHRSRGARLEALAGVELDLLFAYERDGEIIGLPAADVPATLRLMVT